MGLDAAVEHKARPDDRSLKQQAAAHRRNPDAELPDHDPSSRWGVFQGSRSGIAVALVTRGCSRHPSRGINRGINRAMPR